MARQSGKGLTEATYFILLSTVNLIHSYGIITKIRDMTDGEVVVGAGTLYGALNKMVEQGWISVRLEDDQKMYLITSLGKDVLSEEIKRLKKLVELGREHYE